MFDNKKIASVSYIMNNGEESSLNYNIFNRRKLNKLFFKSKYGDNYCVSKEVDLLYFKNCTFNDSFSLSGDKDSVVIFDNCNFEGDELYFKYIGVELINPIFEKNGNPIIEIDFSENVSVIFNEDSEDSDRNMIYKTFDVGSFSLDGGIVKDINIDAANICLKNLRNVDKSYIYFRTAKNLVVSNCDFNNLNFFKVFASDKVILNNFSLYSLNDIDISCSALIVNNTNLKTAKSIDIDGRDCDIYDSENIVEANLKIDNINMRAAYNICINGNFYNSSNGKEVALTDKDFLSGSEMFSKRSLVSILKGYRNLVNDAVDNRKVKCLEDCSDEIDECKERIKELEVKRKRLSKKMDKSLNNRKCSSYIK